MEDPDEETQVYANNDGEAVNDEGFVHPDIEFQDEFGYWIIKMLRGRSTGRQLKRTFFKFGLIHIVCGFVLLILAVDESKNEL
jgi:hypothetical protein